MIFEYMFNPHAGLRETFNYVRASMAWYTNSYKTIIYLITIINLKIYITNS